ncbi:MAG: beta-lactamase family protein [Acidobacteria bacterium]|nr:beta-lactamase family protein [Acidobacteriota bacterium]
MAKSRTPTWLWLILVPVALLLVAIPGMWVYMSTTAPVLHPNPQEVPSVTYSAPLPKSAGAVEQARQIVRARLTEENLPGVSVAVGIGGDIVWAEGFGFADLKTSVPVTPTHRFRIGTASTVLTSAAAGLLLEDGRLKLDDEIQTYVPAFPKKQWPVTLRELMGHTAGVIPDGGDEGPLFTKHCERPLEALPHFAENSLLFEPGTQYRYSDYGWILASAAVEAAADQPFLTFMRERIFDPLGMRNTIPDSAAVEADDDHPLFNFIRERIFDPRTTRETIPDSAKRPMQDRVTPYFPRFSSDPNYGLHLMRPLDFSCHAGSSGFLSTPSDLVRFGMAINSGKLLQPATVQLLQRSQRLASGKNTGYGLGWDIETVTLAGEQTRVAGHDGELLGGMAASLMTFPEHGMVVSITSNISYADTFSLGVKIAEAFVQQGKSPATK